MKEYIQKKISQIVHHELSQNAYQHIPIWIASLVVGIIAVLYAKSFLYVEYLSKMLIELHPLAIFIVSPVAFVLSWWVVKQFAPLAGGSGIPQVMAATESEEMPMIVKKLLNIKVSAIKVISSLIMLAGGGAIGREGPTIQISASIFAFMHYSLPKYWGKLNLQLMVITGAASGLAAAFNTPLGGILFAIEELSRIHFSKIRITLFVAVIISGMTAQGVLGSYLYLGFPRVQLTDYIHTFWIILTALITGCLGGLFGNCLLMIHKWKSSLKTDRARIQTIVLFALIFACMYYFMSHATIGAGKGILEDLLFADNKDISLSIVISRFFGPILSFGSGGAGGIFAPSLSAGGAVGALISVLAEIPSANTNLLILAGMVGFLTGVTHSPFTSAVLVLEMTDRHSVIFYLMLAGMCSYLVAILVNKKSVYEYLKESYLSSFQQV